MIYTVVIIWLVACWISLHLLGTNAECEEMAQLPPSEVKPPLPPVG